MAEISVEQLARVLRDRELAVRVVIQGAPPLAVACVANPDALAESLLEDITGEAHPMPDGVHVTRERLAATLEETVFWVKPEPDQIADGAVFAGKIRHADGAAVRILDAIAGRAGEPEPGAPVVDAHICCEHVPGDRELCAMAEIARLMEAESVRGYDVVRHLALLCPDELARVRTWLLARFRDPGDLPF